MAQVRGGTGAIIAPAAGFAAGIAIGRWLAPACVWPWLAAALALAVAAWCLRRRGNVSIMLLAAAVTALGAAWFKVRTAYIDKTSLAALARGEQALVRVRGMGLSGPRWADAPSGSLARFAHREPSVLFEMAVEAVLDEGGAAIPASGTVLVSVDEQVRAFEAGERLEVTGRLRPPRPPRNPGGFDAVRYARATGGSGVISVPHRDLVRVQRDGERGPGGTWLLWRQKMREAAQDSLRERSGASGRAADHRARDALLQAMLFGVREQGYEQIGPPFQRVGIAHLMAISGLHLTVFAGFILLVVRGTGPRRRWHGFVAIAAVLVYLTVVEVRAPVLRAGVMTMIACLGVAVGRSIRAGGLVALSGLVLLVRRPDELFSPGFQLTFAVVLALVHLAPPIRSRWFGPRPGSPRSLAAMLLEWSKTALATSWAAWLVSIPITLYHFGLFSPLTAPLSIVTIPLGSLLLAAGFAKTIVGLVLPAGGTLLDVPLSASADLLIAIVMASDRAPLSSIPWPPPSVAWTLSALAWVVLFALARGRRLRRGVHLCGAVLAIWALWPVLPLHRAAPLRVDMLDVGDGSCYLVRSRGRAVVFDAGSAHQIDAGNDTIVPALRRLGVRSLDAIIVSHANTDHYSALIELADAFHVGRALLSEAFVAAGRADPAGPVAFVLAALAEREVPIELVAAGEVRRFGDGRWTWLHPEAGGQFKAANNASMVIRVEAAGRALLLCGDIERQAMARLLGDPDALGADVAELPHHGSYSDVAEAFVVEAVQPRFVLQSTGPTRLRADRWEAALAGRERLVTARDGACHVEIDAAGTITAGRSLREPQPPRGPPARRSRP